MRHASDALLTGNWHGFSWMTRCLPTAQASPKKKTAARRPGFAPALAATLKAGALGGRRRACLHTRKRRFPEARALRLAGVDVVRLAGRGQSPISSKLSLNLAAAKYSCYARSRRNFEFRRSCSRNCG